MRKAEMEKRLKAYEDFADKVGRIASADLSDVEELIADGILQGPKEIYTPVSFSPRCLGVISGSVTSLRDQLEDIKKRG